MHKRSLLTVLLCSTALLTLRISAPPQKALTWDVFGYYLYLPATFIHHDIALQDHTWLDDVMTHYEPSSTFYQLVIKYSAGMAVLYAPFFLIAHLSAPLLGYPADGFSLPYQFIIAFGCLLYALLGLSVLRKVLLHFFSDGWTAVLIALIVLGTNYLQLTVWDGTLLTHTPLFLLYGLAPRCNGRFDHTRVPFRRGVPADPAAMASHGPERMGTKVGSAEKALRPSSDRGVGVHSGSFPAAVLLARRYR